MESPSPLWILASEVSYDTRVASWRKLLQNCMNAHDDCRDKIESFTPTRLLEITHLHDREYNVRLVCCQDCSVIGSYTTLSYSWGTGANGPCRTTKDNFNEHMRGIAWLKLTKTIQDAICVTHALGLKLLWVDSLCIIQDDQRDWENEAAKMSDVFAGSELTIAAVAASDSRGGLEIDYIAPPIYDPPGDGYSGALVRWGVSRFGDLETSHLYSRGWVFQEILLSRRRLHFAENHVFWHCRSLVQSEDCHYISHEEEMLPSEIMTIEDWHDLMFTYSGKDFTFRTDRLAALAGVVNWYSKKFELTPLLGLWCETLSLDLGWQNIGRDCEGTTPQRSTIAGLPSWTWLIWDGYVQAPFKNGVKAHVPFLRIIDCSINWAGEPMTSALKSVDLRIQAPLKTFMLTSRQNPAKDGLQLNGWEQSIVILDELGTSSLPYKYTQPKTAQLLILARAQVNLRHARSVVTFLVVEAMPKVTGFPRYKRVGAGHINMMDVSDGDPLKLPLLFSDSVDSIVELI